MPSRYALTANMPGSVPFHAADLAGGLGEDAQALQNMQIAISGIPLEAAKAKLLNDQQQNQLNAAILPSLIKQHEEAANSQENAAQMVAFEHPELATAIATPTASPNKYGQDAVAPMPFTPDQQAAIDVGQTPADHATISTILGQYDPQAARDLQLSDEARKFANEKTLAGIRSMASGIQIVQTPNGYERLNKRDNTSMPAGVGLDGNADGKPGLQPVKYTDIQRVIDGVKHTIRVNMDKSEQDLGPSEALKGTVVDTLNGPVVVNAQLPAGSAPGSAQAVTATTDGKPIMGKAQNAAVESLAKDFQENKVITAYKTVSENLSNIRDAVAMIKDPLVQDKTGAKSSIVEQFQKITNPGSVVRQSAFAQTTSGQSIMNRIESYFNTLKDSSDIAPEAAQSLLDLAEKFADGAKKQANQEMAPLKNRAKSLGVDEKKVFSAIEGLDVGLSADEQSITDALDWAKKNPSDPRAAQIIQKISQ